MSDERTELERLVKELSLAAKSHPAPEYRRAIAQAAALLSERTGERDLKCTVHGRTWSAVTNPDEPCPESEPERLEQALEEASQALFDLTQSMAKGSLRTVIERIYRRMDRATATTPQDAPGWCPHCGNGVLQEHSEGCPRATGEAEGDG